MHDDSLNAPEPKIVEPEYAGFWIRLGAAIIDFVVLVPVMFVNYANVMYVKSVELLILTTLIGLAYKPLLEWHKGATIGKMVLKLQVVNGTFERLTLEQSILRSFPWILSAAITTVNVLFIFLDPAFQEVTEYTEYAEMLTTGPAYVMQTLYGFVFLIIIGYVIVDPKNQGVHDKLANTYCIKNPDGVKLF